MPSIFTYLRGRPFSQRPAVGGKLCPCEPGGGHLEQVRVPQASLQMCTQFAQKVKMTIAGMRFVKIGNDFVLSSINDGLELKQRLV